MRAAAGSDRVLECLRHLRVLVFEVIPEEDERDDDGECHECGGVGPDAFDAELPGRPGESEEFQHAVGYVGEIQKGVGRPTIPVLAGGRR